MKDEASGDGAADDRVPTCWPANGWADRWMADDWVVGDWVLGDF